jgi:hypothetical protein
MAYDESAGVIVLQGGFNLVPETWIWDGSDWTQKGTNEPPTNGLNPGTIGATDVLTYDTSRKQVVLFDGVGPWPNAEVNEVWAWDGTSWNKVAATGDLPVGQSNNPGAFAYHAAGKAEVLFGHLAGQPITWTFSAGAWLRASQAGTTSVNFSLGADEAHGTLVLLGEQGDSWTWDGNAWTLQHPSSFPPQRGNAATGFDPIHKLTLFFGGVTGEQGVNQGSYFGDLWGWDGSNWRNLSSS